MSEEIMIKRAVLHILDNNISMPVLSNSELALEGEILEFLEKHIEKILSDNNLKKARFISENNRLRNIIRNLKDNEAGFLETSHEIAGRLFELMTMHIAIAPADLICCMFERQDAVYMGILKLNYKSGYTHYVENSPEGSMNTVIRHRTLLPSESGRVEECAIINIDDLSIQLMEKAYEINGEKELYLSNLLLQCTTDLSNNEKLKIIDKVTKKINKKYFDEDFEKVAAIKKVVADGIEENCEIKVNEVVSTVFSNNLEIQQEYIEEVKKAGLTEESIHIPEKLAEKKFKTHRIKTDTGIEINFPMSYYTDSDKLEILNNADGSISIMIKNVGKIFNK